VRTTLTLDDDIAKELKVVSRRTGKPLKVVVNETLRRGLDAATSPSRDLPPFRVKPKACGFRPGIDVTKLNQY
jgi:hypothetical protein